MKHLQRIIFSILALFFTATTVFALGAQETSIKNAQKVIENDSGSSDSNNSKNSNTTNSQTQTQNNQQNQSIWQSTPNYGNQSFTYDEAVQGLKAALIEAAIQSSDFLSKEDAYYKNPIYYIDMPKDAEDLIKVVSKVPGGKNMIEDVVLRLNRTAETAAKEIEPIFREAISNMGVQDAVAIVTGKDDAATEYLKRTTYQQLLSLYKPKVNAALDQKLVAKKSANECWEKLTTTYNKASASTNKIGSIFGKSEIMQEVETDLAQYATEKALDAVFLQMAEEEEKIRDDPMDYASSIIRKVFGGR